MKIHYYPETNSLYVELRPGPAADSREVADGVVADFDRSGNLVGLDVDGGAGARPATIEVAGQPPIPLTRACY